MLLLGLLLWRFSPTPHGKVLDGGMPLGFVLLNGGGGRFPWRLGGGCNFLLPREGLPTKWWLKQTCNFL